MKFVRFYYDNKECSGILFKDKIKKIDSSSGAINVNVEYSADEVDFMPPCNPTKIVAVGLNYMDHINETGNKASKEPTVFLKPASSVIAHNESIHLPDCSERVDYEAELAVVISEKCKNVEPKDAKKYIFGYTCLNDVTARDIQERESQWTRAKGYDTFCPIGPCIETDLNPDNLDIKLYLNGELKQHSNTKNMIFKVYELVSYISKIMTLYPGDVISTGTPEGIGRLMPGDEVSVEIENIGRLTNFVMERNMN